MRFINRLCIFLLGFIMGIVGCVGGLAGGVYYAYTGLSVEDFTGTLTKDDIPVLDDDAERNITEMSMEEIVTRFLGLMNGTKDLTIANLEEIYGLDLSSLGLPENIRNMPIDKLFEDEASRNEALSYITFGTIAELLEMFGVDFLTETYPHLFGKDGKLYNVSIIDVIKDDGYIKAFKKVYVSDLLPAGMLEEMEEGYVKDLIAALVEAFSDVSLGELLAAIIKNEGSAVEVILGSESVRAFELSVLIPESLEPIKNLIAGITLGDIVSIGEDGEIVVSFDAVLEKITLRDVLGLVELFDKSVDELLEAIPDGNVKAHVNELLDWSLKQIIDSKDDIGAYFGELTIGDMVDLILAVIGDPDAIKNLPEPVPTLWNAVAVIKIADLLKAIDEGTLEELMNETVLALTLDDLFGSYINDNAEEVPQPALVIWMQVRYFAIYDYIHNIDDVKAALMSLTLGDLIGSYVFDSNFVKIVGGWVYSYNYDKSLESFGGRIPLLPEFICTIFDKIEDYTFEEIYQAYLCEVGECEHVDKSECFTLTDLLGESLYTITLGELFDEFFKDENGETVIPEELMPLYRAVMNITIGDIIRTITGEQSVEELLKGIYELSLGDLFGGLLESIEELPQVVTNIFNRIKNITIGEIVEDWHCIVDALYEVTIGDLIGEYVPEDSALLNLLYGAFKNMTINDIITAIENGDALVLLRGLARTTIRELLIDLADAFEIERTYIINNVIDSFGEKTVGDVLLIIYCKSGNCDKAEWLGHGETCATLLGFLEETLFTLTVADFWNDEELDEAFEVLYNIIESISIQNVYNTIMKLIDPEGYAEAETIFDVLKRTAADLTVGDIFGALIEKVNELKIAHPIPFLVLSLENIKFADIIGAIADGEDWLFIVEALEAQFALVLEDDEYLGLGDNIVYIQQIKEHINSEYSVSIDFLFGYELDSLIDLLLESNINENVVLILKNLIAPIRDLTVRDIYTDYRHIFDCYNNVTFADVFAEALGYERSVLGIWFNRNSTGGTASELFNLLADYTIYDLLYDGGTDEALRSITVRDIIFLIIESIDLDGTWYEGLSDGMKAFLDRFDSITLGMIYDGDITEEDLRAIIGDLRLFDLTTLSVYYRTVYWDFISSIILNIKVIDIIDGNIASILTGIRIIDLIDGFCEAFGWDYDYWCTLAKQIIKNIGSLTIADIFGLNGELTFEDIFFITIKDITIGMFLELIPFGDSRIINVILNSDIYRKLTSFRIEVFFRGEEAIRSELMIFRDITVGDVHRLVRDIIFESYNGNKYQIEALRKQDLVSVYDLITDTENTEEYIKTMFQYEYVYTVLYTYLAPYSTEINDFLDRIFLLLRLDEIIDEVVDISDIELERLPYCTITIIGLVRVNDIIFDQENVVEYFKMMPIGLFLEDALIVSGYLTFETTHYFSKVFEKVFEASMYVNIGHIIKAIEGDESVTFEEIAKTLISYVQISDILFDIIILPFCDKDWNPKEGYENFTEQNFNEILNSGKVTRAIGRIFIINLIFDTEYVIEELRPLTYTDLFENIVALTNISVGSSNTLDKLIENGNSLSIIDTIEGKYELSHILNTLLDGITLQDMTSDMLVALKSAGVIDEETYERYSRFIAETEIVKYTFKYEVVEFINGGFTFDGYLDGIYFYYVTTDLAENVLILIGESELGAKIGAFGVLIDSGKLINIVNAESWQIAVYEVFGSSTLGDLYDVLKEQDICDLKDFEKKFDLFREVVIAELITEFTPDVLFRDLVVGDFIGEELGWLKSGGQYVGSGNDEFANSKVADLINEYLDFVPEKLRNLVVFALGGITVLLYGYVKGYSIDQIIGDKLAESIKETEFYQAIAFVSIQKLVEDGEATLGRIKNLTFGDLYRFVAAVINEYLVDINCVLETKLFTKFEDNLDEIKLIWITEEGKITVEMLFGGLSMGDLVRSVLDLANVNGLGTELQALLDKLLNNLDKIELIRLGEYEVKDYLKGITYGDLMRAIEELLVGYGVIEEELPENVRKLLDVIENNLDGIAVYNYEMLLTNVVLENVTVGVVIRAALEIAELSVDEIFKSVPEIKAIVNTLLNNLDDIEINLIGSYELKDYIKGITFGDAIRAIEELLNEAGVDTKAIPASVRTILDKITSNVDVIELYNYEYLTAEIVFSGITWGHVLDAVLELLGITTDSLKEATLAIVNKISDNLYAIELVDVEALTAYNVLYGISLGNVFDAFAEYTEITFEYKDLQLYTKIASIYLHEFFADDMALVTDKLYAIDANDFVEIILLAADYELITEIGNKLYANLDNLTIKVLVDGATTEEIVEIILDGITYGDLVRGIIAIIEENSTFDYDSLDKTVLKITDRLLKNLDGIELLDTESITDLRIVLAGITYGAVIRMLIAVFDIDLSELPERAEAMLNTIISNLDPVELMNYEMLVADVILAGISLGDVVRLALDLAEVDFEELNLPAKTQAIIDLLLGNWDKIALARIADATLEDYLGKLTWRQVAEAILEAIGADLDALKTEARKLADKVLKNLDFPVYLTTDLALEMLLANITYADIARPILEVLGVCIAQFDEDEHIGDEAHGVEFKAGTKALLGKYLSNMEDAYLLDLAKGYIAIRETLDGLTIGDHLEALYDYTGKPSEIAYENETYIKLAAVTLIDMLVDMDEVISRFEDITVVEFIEFVISFAGYVIDEIIKTHQLYQKVAVLKLKELITDEEAVKTVIYSIDANDIVEALLYIFDGYVLETEMCKLIYSNLDNLTVDLAVNGDLTAKDALEIAFDGVTYGMLYEHVLTFITYEVATNEAIEALNIYVYIENYEIVDSINDAEAFLKGIYFNWLTTDIAVMVLKLNGNNNAAIYTEAFAELTEEATLYALLNADGIKQAVYVLFGDSTIGTVADIFSRLNVFKVEEQTYAKKFDLFRTVLLADLITNFVPDTLFRDLVVGDLVGEELGWLKGVDGKWGGSFDDEFANKKVADLVNEWLAFIPECLRNLVVIALGGASAVLYAYIENKTIDEVVGEKLPDRIKETAIYKALAFVSIRKLIDDIETVKADVEALTLADAYDLVVAIIASYLYGDVDTILDVDLINKLKANLAEIKLVEAGSVTLEQLLNGITYADLVNAILYWTGADLSVLDSHMTAVVDKLIDNLGDIELMKYELLTSEIVASGINCREVVELVACLGGRIAGLDYEFDLNTIFKEETQKLVDVILNNLEDIMITELDETSIYEVLDGVTYGMVIRVLLEGFELDVNELGTETLKLVNQLLKNLDKIGIFEIDELSDIDRIFKDVTYGMVIRAALEILEIDVNEFGVETQKLVNQLLDNFDEIVLFDIYTLDDAAMIIENVTYGMVIRCIIELVEIDMEALGEYTKSLADKLLANLDGIELLEINEAEDLLKITDGITYGDVVNAVMEIAAVSVAVEIRALQLYGKLAAIYVNDAFDNRSHFFGTLKSIDINDLLEVILEACGYELRSEAAKKIYDNCDAFTFEYLMADDFSALDMMLKLVDGITIGELADAAEIVYGSENNVTNAINTLIGDAEVAVLLVSGEYRAFVNELFGDSKVSDVYDVLKDFGVNIEANETVAYYEGLFADVLLRNIFADPTPENIFGDITWTDVFGPIGGFTKNAEGKYTTPSYVSATAASILLTKVSETLYEIFGGLHPYIITAIAADITVHVVIIVYAAVANGFDLENLLDITISELLDKTGLYEQLGGYGDVINSVIGDANILGLILCGSYSDFVNVLFGDSTLKDLMQHFEFYHDDKYADIKEIAQLFEDRKFAEIFNDPSPAVIFGNVTVGQLVGNILGWTPKNADKTIWSGSGALADQANRMIVDLIDDIYGFNTLHPHVQTAVILGVVGAAYGAYAILDYYAPEINELLSGRTIAQLIELNSLTDYMYANRGALAAELLVFIYNNYGTKTILQLVTYIIEGNIVELGSGVEIGEILDIIDCTNVITEAKKNETLKTIIEAMEDVLLLDVVFADDVLDAIKILVGGLTLVDILGIEETAEGYKLGETVIPDSMLMYDEGTSFKTLSAAVAPAGKKLYTVGQLIGFIENGSIFENYVGNIVLGDAWSMFDDGTMLNGVVGLIVYNFLDENTDKTLNVVFDMFYEGDAFEVLLSDITVGEILDELGTEVEEDLGFIGKMFRNNASKKVVEIVYSDAFLNELAGDMKLGEVMGYTYDADENVWKDVNGHELDILNTAFANILLIDVFYGTIDITDELKDVLLGELMNFYFDETEDVWYKDATKTEKVDTLVAAVCGIKLDDLMGDDAEQTIKDALGDLYIGTIMNLTKKSDGWYNGENKAEFVIAKIADIKLSALFNGEFTVANVFTGNLGEYIGYTRAADGWYNGSVKADAIMNNVCGLEMSKLLSGDVEAADLLEAIRVGDLIPGAAYDGSKWIDTNNADTPFGEMYNKVFNIELDDVIENGIDLAVVFGGLKIGSIIGYTYDSGKWFDGSDEVTNPAMVRLAGLDLGELLTSGLDFKALFNGLKIGEVLGMTYTYDAATNTYTWYEAGATVMLSKLVSAIYGLDFVDCTNMTKVVEAIGYLRIGDLSASFTWDATTGKWSNTATSAEVDSMTGKILSITITQLSAGNITALLFGGMKLGDVMFGAYYYSEGKWYVTKTNKEVYVLTARLLEVQFDNLISNPSDIIQNSVFSIQFGTLMGWTSAYNADDGEWQWKKANGTWTTPIENKIGSFNFQNLVNGSLNWEYVIMNLKVSEVFGPKMDRTGILSIVRDNVTLKDLSSEINRILTEGKVGDLREAGIINLTDDQMVKLAQKLGATSSYHIDLQWTLGDLITAMTNYILNH